MAREAALSYSDRAELNVAPLSILATSDLLVNLVDWSRDPREKSVQVQNVEKKKRKEKEKNESCLRF